jgi:hypothetical protein
MPENDAAMARVEDQIEWFDKKSRRNFQWFRTLKTLTIILAALIPVVTGSIDPHASSRIAGGLGALVAMMEGIQHLNQFHENWITYRYASETLQHEKYLYLASAGPYASASNSRTLFVERVESVIAQEHEKWSASHESVQQGAHAQ